MTQCKAYELAYWISHHDLLVGLPMSNMVKNWTVKLGKMGYFDIVNVTLGSTWAHICDPTIWPNFFLINVGPQKNSTWLTLVATFDPKYFLVE